MNKKLHDNSAEISDEMIALLFDAKESGKSFPDALLVSGLNADAPDLTLLRSLWDLHGNITREAHNISPDSRLLTRMLEALPAITPASTVTTPPPVGYVSRGSTFDRINSNFKVMMQMNWKIGAPIFIVVVAVVLVVNMGGNAAPPAQLAMNSIEGDTENTTNLMAVSETGVEGAPTMAMARSAKSMADAPVSGEIDDLALSIVVEADGDLMLLDDASGDATLVYSDGQSINDFNTSYDETTF